MENQDVEQPVDEVLNQPQEEDHQSDLEPNVEPEKKEDSAIPKGVQKRIDRAVRDKYRAEAEANSLKERLAALEQRAYATQQQPNKTVDAGEPKLVDFDNFEEFVSAKAEYIAEKRINQTLSEREAKQVAERETAARQKTAESWSQRLVEATAEMPDFEDVVSSSTVPMSESMRMAIMESDVGPKLAYHLASNPDEAIKIAEMSHLSQIKALGRLEERLSAKSPIRASNAPAPISPVGSRASVSKDPDKMSAEEWVKWREGQIKKQRA